MVSFSPRISNDLLNFKISDKLDQANEMQMKSVALIDVLLSTCVTFLVQKLVMIWQFLKLEIEISGTVVSFNLNFKEIHGPTEENKSYIIEGQDMKSDINIDIAWLIFFLFTK